MSEFRPYDLHGFLSDVREILREKGVDVSSQDDPRPLDAAAILLRSFGLTPVTDHVESLKRNMNEPWPEKDERA